MEISGCFQAGHHGRNPPVEAAFVVARPRPLVRNHQSFRKIPGKAPFKMGRMGILKSDFIQPADRRDKELGVVGTVRRGHPEFADPGEGLVGQEFAGSVAAIEQGGWLQKNTPIL